MTKAYIANAGLVSAIGNDVEENLQSLLTKSSGISNFDFLRTRHNLPVGEIKMSNAELGAMLAINIDLPRTALLSIMAAKEAWKPFVGNNKGLRIGLISANTVGGMDITEKNYASFRNGNHDCPASIFRHHECGAITQLTAQALKESSWNATISTACSSSANSIMLAAKLIQRDRYDVIIAGGSDALSLFTLNGFNSLMILDKEACRPFNEHRKGLNLGEGAAYLVLANEKAMRYWNAESNIYISGYANTNDAHHQTASSPEGKGNFLAMSNALETAGLSPKDIDYINLHGTGTQNNDDSEGAAIERLFGNSIEIPYCSSTKTYTGHTLGASGAIEAVFSYLSLTHQKAWAHLRMDKKMPQFDWQPIQDIESTPITHVLSNSFGFGGNCSSLVISKL